MVRVSRNHRLLLLLGLLLFGGVPAGRAVIFYSTGDVEYHTSAPDGVLSNSGWQFVGTWGGFQGAAIGPHHFIAVRHVGGAIGDVFTLNGTGHTTVAFFDDPASDLRIWQVSEPFSAWASLYRASDEVGKPLVVFGRGLARGGEIRVRGALKGWYWGDGDGRLRWGKNVIASAKNDGGYWGELLYATFDASGGADEAHLAVGDSSGPVFIHDGSEWALAGVAAAVDGYFNTTNSGSGFRAAIFDARGLYYSPDPSTVPWALVTGSSPVPTGFYVTRISARLAWIESIVPRTMDAPIFDSFGRLTLAVSLFAVAALRLRRRRRLTGPRDS